MASASPVQTASATSTALSSSESIILRTRKKLFHILHGEHESLFGGRGLEFREVREYSNEDDIRHLNWKITARTGTPTVNLYNETRQIPVVLVYLNSGGLLFGEAHSKKESAIEVLTALSYAAVSKHDTLRTLFYASNESLWTAPGRHRGIVHLNFSTASQLDPLGHTVDFDLLGREILQTLKRKSLLFLIGDFWEFTEKHDLGKLAFQHELYCIVIRDRAEEKLSLRGSYTVTDPHTEKSQRLSIDSKTAARYHALAQSHETMLQRHFSQHRIASAKIYTDEDAIEKLALFLGR